MLEFKKYIGPNGIPVYHQSLPMVESVAIHWIIFTGSADDAEVGTEGAYHWFEHVPFRGTVDFPDNMAIKGPFPPRGGNVGAWTNTTCTCFWACVHHSQAELALRVVTDLWSRPLMTNEAIEAERKIIFQEIGRSTSQLAGTANYEMPRLLWPGNSVGHPTLGSIESLQKLQCADLRRAHEQGYSSSRAVLFVSGNDANIHAVLEKVCAIIPQTKLSERRQSASYGQLSPWQKGVTEVSVNFVGSQIYVLFPLAGTNSTPREIAVRAIAHNLVDNGGMSSPLYQTVRVKHHLAYSTGFWAREFVDGGAGGFWVQTNENHLNAARDAIFEAVNDPRVRSSERFKEVLTGFEYTKRMRPIDPMKFNEAARNSLFGFGQVFSDKEIDDLYHSISHKEVLAILDQYTPDVARTILFRGKEKT